MAKKIGEDHAKEMFRRGLAELQAASYFQESNIAQPNYHTLHGAREAEPPPIPERGPEAGHER